MQGRRRFSIGDVDLKTKNETCDTDREARRRHAI